MKRLAFGVLILSIFLISSCAELFEFNMFSEMDYVETISAADISNAEGDELESLTEDLIDDLRSDTYVQELLSGDDEEDSAIIQAVVTALEAQYDDIDGYAPDSFNPASAQYDPAAVEELFEAQEAAVAAANLQLAASGADQLTDNLQNIVSDLATGGGETDPMADPTSLMTSLLPASMTTASGDLDPASEAEFVEMLLGLQDASDSLAVLGSDLLIDGAEENPDLILGDVVPVAIVSIVVDEMIDEIVATDGVTEEEAAAQIFSALSGGGATLPAIDMDGLSAEGGTLYNLLSYSGLDGLF